MECICWWYKVRKAIVLEIEVVIFFQYVWNNFRPPLNQNHFTIKQILFYFSDTITMNKIIFLIQFTIILLHLFEHIENWISALWYLKVLFKNRNNQVRYFSPKQCFRVNTKELSNSITCTSFFYFIYLKRIVCRV